MGYEPIKEETKELYLKIWVNFAVGHFSHEQLAKLFNCSTDTISNGIKWAAINRVRFDAYVLSEAAKEALENRLRELRSDLVRVKEGNPINWNCLIGLNRLIKENEELLWQFQGVIQDKTFIINNIQSEQLMDKGEKEERELVELVNSWTPEQTESFLVLAKAMKAGKEIKVEKGGQTTIIRIKNVEEAKEKENNVDSN